MQTLAKQFKEGGPGVFQGTLGMVLQVTPNGAIHHLDRSVSSSKSLNLYDDDYERLAPTATLRWDDNLWVDGKWLGEQLARGTSVLVLTEAGLSIGLIDSYGDAIWRESGVRCDSSFQKDNQRILGIWLDQRPLPVVEEKPEEKPDVEPGHLPGMRQLIAHLRANADSIELEVEKLNPRKVK